MGKYNDHRRLEGKHSYLSCSQPSWENRNEEQLIKMYYSKFATDIGTAVHAFAHDCIIRKLKVNENDYHMIDYYLQVIYPLQTGVIIPKGAYDSVTLMKTVSLFVNDMIGFRMDSEIVLCYDEEFAFGTTDGIRCDDKEKIIRIGDLKSGVNPAKMVQLLLYDAYYCLEYKKNPKEYKHELRIYQNGNIIEYFPMGEEVEEHMKNIVTATEILRTKTERI